MPRPLPALLLAATVSGLAGCQVLGSLAEERTLRALTVFVLVAALLGFVYARMRR